MELRNFIITIIIGGMPSGSFTVETFAQASPDKLKAIINKLSKRTRGTIYKILPSITARRYLKTFKVKNIIL